MRHNPDCRRRAASSTQQADHGSAARAAWLNRRSKATGGVQVSSRPHYPTRQVFGLTWRRWKRFVSRPYPNPDYLPKHMPQFGPAHFNSFLGST
eukprot:scaffold519178_cov41-Prasinocladus_malaysianus.AAC.1